MSASSPLAGTDIGRYRIVSLLGAGGMGDVYDAIDASLGRHVALKILKGDAVADPKRRTRFVQEARAASALNHPHLVSIYEIGEQDGVHFIAMEKVEGATLRQISTSERLPLERALDLMVQITEAVAAAHAAGIVHRDLKPENVMVSVGGYAKVLDFGLAKLLPDAELPSDASASTLFKATDFGTILGTVGYMSPEQAQGRAADARSDIFSLGCVLYEAITGRRAFQAASAIDTLHKIMHQEPPPLRQIAPDAPAEAQRIVQKAMAKSPDERYQSAKDLALDLRALLRELRSGGGSVPAVERTQSRMPAVSIAVAAVVVLIALAAVLLWQRTAHVRVAPPAIAFQRITAKGNLTTVRISPDGRFIAYSLQETNGQSLWLRQLATGEDLELVPRQPGVFLGGAFTPDGNSVVYGFKSAPEPAGTFYRVSTIGGEPQRLLSGIDSAPSFSPDGKRMCWVRAEFPTSSDSALIAANSDGTGERVLATKRYPELFAPISFAHPSWSPDGKLIAAAVKRVRDPDAAQLMGFDPENGRETLLSKSHWVSLSALQWLPDQSGIIAIGASTSAEIHALTQTGNQIWLIPYPTGEPRRITNDLLYYREISISADGKKLVADVADATVNIARKPREGEGQAGGISSGHFDGVAGLSAMSNGALVFSSIEGGITTLWTINQDGSRRRQLLRHPFRDEYPVAFSGGIAYVSATPAGTDLCETGNDGEDRRVVFRGIDDGPVAVSPDGKSFVYPLNRRLWMISPRQRQPRQLTREIASNPAFSPRADRIAYIGDNTTANGHMRLIVTNNDGVETWSSEIRQPGARQLRWTNDGNGLLVCDWHEIWLYPLHGEPKNFVALDDLIWSFVVSPDDVLFVSHGTLTRDAVLITGFR